MNDTFEVGTTVIFLKLYIGMMRDYESKIFDEKDDEINEAKYLRNRYQTYG